ncbi:MAG: YgfZ/GcvT domain-containing protein [Woeseia sp.]
MPDVTVKLIRVAGSDAGEFLQGQLTQDIERVAGAGSLLAACCNPKGRVITVLRILMCDDGYGLVLPASMADAVCERLTVYRLRADVSLEVQGPQWTCLVMHTDEDLEQLAKLELKPQQRINACRIGHGLLAVNIGIDEQCVEVMGFRGDLEQAGIDAGKHTDLDLVSGARIRAGVPEILGGMSEKYTPHMLNLDLLGAISFDKGCYTGQEVVARTEHLGSSKRRLMRYRAEDQLAAGDKLSDGDKDIGEVVNVSGQDLLAVTPVKKHQQTLYAGGAAVTPVPLA